MSARNAGLASELVAARAPTRAALFVPLLFVAIAGTAMLLENHLTIASNPLDFRAFYCAGDALLRGADPYRAEPLRSCEAAALRMAGLSGIPHLAIPAPLPGYALPMFMLAARIDFISASTLFALASLAAVGVTVVTLRRLTSLPIVTIFVALVLADGYVGLLNGQVVPICIMLLCLAALATELERPWLAAICCAAVTIEPHLALPACASLALFVPRARLPLAVCAAVLSAVSVATLGIARNVEYLTQVLPAHVASEATNAGQYSLTSVLSHVGIPVDVAIRAGEVSYGLMIVAGLAITHRLRERPHCAAYIVLMPVAFALLGGPFVHVVQIGAAIPGALLLTSKSPLPRPMIVAALALLSIPWLSLVRTSGATPPALFVAAASVAAAVVWPLLRERYVSSAVTLGAALFVLAGGTFMLWLPAVSRAPDPARQLLRVADGRELAEQTWTVYERISQTRETTPIVAAKMPTWIGLLLVLVFAFRTGTCGANTLRELLPSEGKAA